MAFQVKSALSITASMINRVRSVTRKLTDFNPGSKIRTLLEAVAQEIDELYQQLLIGIREAIGTSTYTTFDFPLLAATAATGLVRVTITPAAADITIAVGAVLTRDDGAVTYTALASVTIAASSSYGDVPVAATVAGTLGNLAAGTGFSMTTPPAGFVSALALGDFVTGSAAETEALRKARFAAFIASLPRATVAALQYALLRKTFLTTPAGLVTERVATCSIVEPDLTNPLVPDRIVRAYIHNGTGGTTLDLVARANDIITGYTDTNGVKVPGYKAAGVPVVVVAATETTVAFTAALKAGAGYDPAALATEASAAVLAYNLGLEVGASFIRSEAIAIAMALPGVVNFTISAPSADVVPAATVKLMPGTYAVTGS